MFWVLFFFFFQAEDGIRDAQESRGLGDVYKRQEEVQPEGVSTDEWLQCGTADSRLAVEVTDCAPTWLSLIHI